MGDTAIGYQNSLNTSRKRLTNITEVIFVILLLGGVLILQYYSKATGILFKPFTESDVLAIITSMFIVAIFMERSVDAILTPVRCPDRQKIEHQLEALREAAERDNGAQEERRKIERELEVYKLKTSQYAYWISFLFGLLISLVGVRTLAGLVESEALKALGDWHRNLFSFVDIVLTGGVIAGGSSAIDKIGRKISGHFNLRSAADPKSSVKPGQ